jgi:hypothetical protein
VAGVGYSGEPPMRNVRGRCTLEGMNLRGGNKTTVGVVTVALVAGIGIGIGFAVAGGGSNGQPINARVVDQSSDLPSESPTPTDTPTLTPSPTDTPTVIPTPTLTAQPVQTQTVASATQQQTSAAPALPPGAIWRTYPPSVPLPYGGQCYQEPTGGDDAPSRIVCPTH